MKNILVPTDFSPCAQQAGDVAVMLGRRFDATVHLLTCLDIPAAWTSLSEAEKKKYPAVLEDIRRTTWMLEEKKKQSDVHMRASWESGELMENIEAYIRKHHIDLIVMGSHGASGPHELFIGSVTQKVVRAVHCPILIVKNPLPDLDFSEVVFASNFHPEELPAFGRFLKFIRPFSPQVIHLALIRASAFQAPTETLQAAMQPFADLCKPLVCKPHIFMYFSISDGIEAFAKKTGARLIALSNHHRRPLRRMFVGSNVEMLVNHAGLPVLTIDFEET